MKLKLKAPTFFPPYLSKPAPRQPSVLKSSDKLAHTKALTGGKSGPSQGISHIEQGHPKKATHMWTQLIGSGREAGERPRRAGLSFRSQ